jgi:hypothetical protein
VDGVRGVLVDQDDEVFVVVGAVGEGDVPAEALERHRLRRAAVERDFGQVLVLDSAT